MRKIVAAGIACLPFLAGCQNNLPPLETSPGVPGPTVKDIVDHIDCTIAEVVNYPDGNGMYDAQAYQRIGERVNGDPTKGDPALDLNGLLSKLATYNFVASAQLTLEVTDNEGLNPSFSFVTPFDASGNRTFGVGAQLTGTQDRSLTFSYSIDLAALHAKKDAQRNLYKALNSSPAFDSASRCAPHNDSAITQLAQAATLNGGIAGDLGLTDIIIDGLKGLNDTAKENVYGSTGPTALTSNNKLDITGTLNGGKTRASYRAELTGQLIFSPPAAGTIAPQTVTLPGKLTLTDSKGATVPYVVDWTGVVALPSTSGPQYFTLTGNPTPIGDAIADIGANPTATLTGTMDATYTIVDISGIITPGGLPKTVTPSPPPYRLVLDTVVPGKEKPTITPNTYNEELLGALAAPAGAGKGGASGGASASQGTSFGSIVDFTLVWGANASANWTLTAGHWGGTNFKGPSAGGGSSSTGGGGGQLFNYSRTRIDTLNITFVPACRNPNINVPDADKGTYWAALPPCDNFGTAQAQASALGYQQLLFNNFR